MRIEERSGGFDLLIDERLILSHRPDAPALYVGRGEERMEMYRGNFAIDDYLVARIPMAMASIRPTQEGWAIDFAASPAANPTLTLNVRSDRRAIEVACHDAGLNRFWLRVAAEPGEHVWGGGEQMSYFDLRGRRFPLWTSEPGVGRDKSTFLTFQADREGRAGGDYYTTNYPQPTFVSSRRFALHVATTAYAVFDFRHLDFHEIEVWAVPERIELFAEDSFIELVTTLSNRFGRQPRLPEWIMVGAVIGLKDGERSFDRLETYLSAGAVVSGLWCEDWAGLRQTSFGTRLFWNWQASERRYPDLRERIADLRRRGIRFMAYVSPYLCSDGPLFAEAEALGHFATNADGGTYLVDFGEFTCGVVDLSDLAASAWFEQRILGQNMLDLGMSGWMADFGEYLPIDVRLKNGADPKLMHNAWPVLWAETNAKAVASRQMTGDGVFFMRAGYTGSQAHCPLLWAGDQSVDFSRHDGLVTAICSALSSGLLGNAYHHSDIGGYTSLFGNVRTAELLMRWAEMAAFTPVMRTHEGNRPTDNLQVDQDPQVLAHFARMTRIHAALVPYFASLCDEAVDRGLPLQRPLFLHHEDDPATYALQDSYLLGPDLLIAPVSAADQDRWQTYLPAGSQWAHLWEGRSQDGGRTVEVASPLGYPPVFFRANSRFRELFETIGSL